MNTAYLTMGMSIHALVNALGYKLL